MTSFQCLSTVLKSRPSSGICFIMSSEEKIGSRYSHWACTFSHSSMVSWMRSRRSSHSWSHTTGDEVCAGLERLTRLTLISELRELGANLDLIFQRFDERRAPHRLSLDNLVIKQRLNVVQGGKDGDIAFPVALVMEFNVIPRFDHGPHRLLQGELLQTQTVCA